MKPIFISLILVFSTVVKSTLSDPFSLLGIPTLNPSQIFNEESNFMNPPPKQELVIRNIDDLPRFLQQSKLSQEEGIKIISKFLIADDYMLKKFGAIFDQTGIDGLMPMERIYPIGHKERNSQMARSAARLYYINNFNDKTFEAYGCEKIEGGVNEWEVYKVLLIGKGGNNPYSNNIQNNHIFLKVCLPLDEMLVPLVTQFNVECTDNIKYEEEAKLKNAPYLDKIIQSNFFKYKENKPSAGIQKPGLINAFQGQKNNITTPPVQNAKTQQIQDFPQYGKINQNQNNQKINSFNILNNTPSFLMKAENPHPQENTQINISRFGSTLQGENLRQNGTKTQGLEAKVELMTQKLNKLENRVESDEKVTLSTKNDIKDLKNNLDQNFGKLDIILEKLATKLK